MSIKTREQERAENAWGKIERVSANLKSSTGAQLATKIQEGLISAKAMKEYISYTR